MCHVCDFNKLIELSCKWRWVYWSGFNTPELRYLYYKYLTLCILAHQSFTIRSLCKQHVERSHISCTWFSFSLWWTTPTVFLITSYCCGTVLSGSAAKIIQRQSNQYIRQPWEQLCISPITWLSRWQGEQYCLFHAALDMLADAPVDWLYLPSLCKCNSISAVMNFLSALPRSISETPEARGQEVAKSTKELWWLLQEKSSLHKGLCSRALPPCMHAVPAATHAAWLINTTVI